MSAIESQTPGLEHYKKRQWLSISSLVSFSRCPRQYFYGSGCRLESPDPAPALQFGAALHRAIPQLMSGEPATTLSRAIEAFDHEWDGSLDDDKRNRASAIRMLMSFAGTHPRDRGLYELLPPPTGPWVIKVPDRVSDWEIPFAVDIGLDVPLVGRIDGWGRNRDTGELWAIEYKTTSELSTRFLESFNLNPQSIGYPAILRLSGLPVRGCIIEGLLVSKTRNESLCKPVYVEDHHIQDFIQWARWTGAQILECERRGYFPKDLSACNPYSQHGSPGFTCRYDSLCLPSDWTTLKDFYQEKKEQGLVL
jgi:hypothetical protein